ncbi:MAG: tRNA 2-thiouridine(34) synthase MnmA [Desulfobacula sp. RIFOXYB2_FULL_45_6]|nr:MAG: tRNA 2-thiouridine(34) synthase MnmA [Desulfobacula sp. RIFOXYB2_FULL_45_6]
MKDPVIAVALSGGIDSLVSGYLLKQKYKHVFGIHFRTGYEKEPIDPSRLEHQLGFPVTCIDLSKVFEEKVISYFTRTYLNGKTPNPCIVCNKEIKFGSLMTQASQMGADFLATGHYATVINAFSCPSKKITRPYLEKAADPLKDQSYFLSMLTPTQLGKIIFPLAGMTKEKVKSLAKTKNFKPLHPSESQDICFIQNNDLSKFILEKQNIKFEHGNIVDMDGKIVGRHNGLHQFTIGQRKGINSPAREAYYVKRIDSQKNILEVCFKKDLSTKRFQVEKINWNGPELEIVPDIITKIRYSHKGALSTLKRKGPFGEVIFNDPQNAVTPGQAAVFYNEARVLGAGIIQ